MALAHGCGLRHLLASLTKAMGATNPAVLTDPWVLPIGGAHMLGKTGEPGPADPFHRH
jgi:hypothetical protein